MITVKRPDGKSCDAYFVEPLAPGAPGIVVIQEWWGLTDQIKGVGNRLAAAGYRVLVPDLYRGTLTLDATEAEHLMTNLDFGDAASQDVRGAVQYLKCGSRKVGIVGFCMGGALTILAAVHVAEADAAVAWYGFPPLEFVDASRITMPLLGHFAGADAHFPTAGVGALAAKLRSAGVAFEFHEYDAEHAFANETGPHYDAAAADLAWKRTMGFLDKHL